MRLFVQYHKWYSRFSKVKNVFSSAANEPKAARVVL